MDWSKEDLEEARQLAKEIDKREGEIYMSKKMVIEKSVSFNYDTVKLTLESTDGDILRDTEYLDSVLQVEAGKLFNNHFGKPADDKSAKKTYPKNDYKSNNRPQPERAETPKPTSSAGLSPQEWIEQLGFGTPKQWKILTDAGIDVRTVNTYDELQAHIKTIFSKPKK
jgi:hypothetical protein